MPKIVISYRRSDSGVTGRIFDRLVAHFGRDSVFIDIDDIPVGIDFREHIATALQESDLLMAVVGANWLGTGESAGSRIMQDDDPVRVELEIGFKRGIPVIPVLVERARMPPANDLPDSLRDFAFLNAATVDVGRDFHQHVSTLIQSIDDTIAGKSKRVLSVAITPVPTNATLAPPQGAAATLALAKQYCRDDASSVEWHELLAGEVSKYRAFVTGSDYPSAAPTKENFNRLVREIVSRTEVLRLACLVSGRWGTAEANRAVAKAISAIALSYTERSGFALWNSMRNFGASLCMQWAVAGTLYRDDFNAARAIMHEVVRMGTTDQHPSVSVLYPLSFEYVDWKLLDGLENRLTPISDFMYSMFTSESSDIVMAREDADELFDKVEFLITLEFSYFRLRRIEKSPHLWFWAPHGRFAWKAGNRRFRMLDEYEALTSDSPIFKAGLLGGSAASLRRIAAAVREFFGKFGGEYDN
jgi:hypothetical protein